MGRALPNLAYEAVLTESGAEHLAATAAAGGQHTAAVLGGHTGTEAVHLGTMPLIGLISALHRILLIYIKHKWRLLQFANPIHHDK